MRAGLAGLAFLAIAVAVAGCSLLPSPTPAGPPPPPGANVVPPERMTLSVSNGTTLPVSLVVNGSGVAVIQPQDGINEMPAAQLPPLPWAVEIDAPERSGPGVGGDPSRRHLAAARHRTAAPRP